MDRSSYIKQLIGEIEIEKDQALKNPRVFVPTQSENFKIDYPGRSVDSLAALELSFLQKFKSRLISNRYSRYCFTWLKTLIRIGTLRREIFSRLDRADTLSRQLEERLTEAVTRMDTRIHELETKNSEFQGEKIFINDTMNLDEYYFHFENRFRGSREQILSEMNSYLPLLKATNIDFERYPILDVGCGRGEWLEVLKGSGIPAKGIDINTKMIQICRTFALDADLCDVLSYLQKLPSASMGGISAFQVVEHISFKDLIEFLRQCRRVLIPEGFVLFETPNPENFGVGSCDFYYDMSHINPIPPEALGFLLGNSGFTQMETIRTQPVKENAEFVSSVDNPATKMVVARFFGPRNYAIFASARQSIGH